MRTRIDMVTPDYYGEELKYQQVVDGRQNAALLSTPVIIEQPAEGVKLIFPAEMKDKAVKGQLTFYRPSDSNKDIRLPLQPDSEGQQLINKQLFIKGLYKVKLQWTMNNRPFYQEQSLNIY
jgi:hypothetical protein